MGERSLVIGELIPGELISYQRTDKGARPSLPPLVGTIMSWGLGQVCRKVKCLRYIGEAGTGGSGDAQIIRE